MPVLPLVGSIISTPGLSMPRCSASQIMDAPIRHFTEYAGFRPSILARTVALAPPVIRFKRTSGVLPMLSVLSVKSKVVLLDLTERLIEIGDQILYIFEPDRNTNEV